MKDLSPYMLSTSVRRCEAFAWFSILLECRSIPHGWRILTLLWVIKVMGSFMSRAFFSILLSLLLMQIFPWVTTLAKDVAGLWTSDSLKCYALSPNISWFEWITLNFSSLKWMKCSFRDFEGLWLIFNRLVFVMFLCLLMTNWWTNFFTKSWCLVIESRGRPVYHPKAAYLKVSNRSLHFK